MYGGKFAPYHLGPAYVFNNVHDNSVPGRDGRSGWNNGDNYDTYNNLAAGLYNFNNTYINKAGGWGSLLVSVRQRTNGIIYLTNLFYLNNIDWNSLGGFQWNGYTPASAVANLVSDYNAYTNHYSSPKNYNLPGPGANRTNLAGLQAAWPQAEQHSVCGVITFVNWDGIRGSSNGDFHLARGSLGIAQGTNLSALFNTNDYPFNALPAQWRVDLDAEGPPRSHARGLAWDMGAYAYTNNSITPIGRRTPARHAIHL